MIGGSITVITDGQTGCVWSWFDEIIVVEVIDWLESDNREAFRNTNEHRACRLLV